MTSVDVRFAFNKAPEIDFIQRGQVVLYDTCMIVSGPLLRFRLPFITRILEGLLAWPSYRTIPYGAVVRYLTKFTLKRHTTFMGPFHRQHIVDFRLPSGKQVRLSFAVLGGAERSKAFQAALNDNLVSTKALFQK